MNSFNPKFPIAGLGVGGILGGLGGLALGGPLGAAAGGVAGGGAGSLLDLVVQLGNYSKSPIGQLEGQLILSQDPSMKSLIDDRNRKELEQLYTQLQMYQ